MLRRVTSTLCLLLTFALAAAAGQATAQEPGVFVDPESPSAKEYALPLEAARQEATGEKRTSVRPGTREAPLFGQGVSEEGDAGDGRSQSSPSPAGGGDGSGGGEDSASASDQSGPTGSGTGDASAGDGQEDGRTTQSAGSDSSLALVGGSLGALLVIVLAGAALRSTRSAD